MATVQLPHIIAKGSAFECGEQYGAQAAKMIRRNIDHYLDRWNRSWGATHAEIMGKAKPFIQSIGSFDASILEYMQGLAKGSGLLLEEVMALNARYEISFSNPMLKPQTDGCTAMAAMPEVTKNGHTLLAQNWDFFPKFAGLRIFLEVSQTGKPAFASVTEAGVVGHRGMNSAGVGVMFNALTTNWDKFEAKTPFPVIMFAMLCAETLGFAMKAALGTKTAASGNILCAHRDGESFDLEFCPKNVAAIYAEGGIITHTNHFIDYTERQGMVDNLRTLIPDSLIRLNRSRKLLEAERGNISLATFQKVFKDHFNYPKSICRHVHEKEDILAQDTTLSSTIIDMTDGVFYVADGTPCTVDYERIVPACLRGEKAAVSV